MIIIVNGYNYLGDGAASDCVTQSVSPATRSVHVTIWLASCMFWWLQIPETKHTNTFVVKNEYYFTIMDLLLDS